MNLLVFTLLTILPSSLSLTHTLPAPAISTFEKSYISTFPNTTNYTPKPTRLIGYKSISIPALELPSFNDHYTSNTPAWEAIPNTFYDKASSSLRVYFPVKGALVKNKHGEILEADEFGGLDLVVDNEVVVLGRKQTGNVRGVVGNIVKDGVIWLGEGNKATHFYEVGGEKMFVFDFGIKLIHDHSTHDLKTRDGIEIRKVSCINNHGGPNCSNKFNIHKGRCPFQSRACMDFNGYWTNCKNASPTSFTGVRNFPGSDCDYAMGRGECWNEIM